MSWWGTLEASFKASSLVDIDSVTRDLPTGSESGPSVTLHEDKVFVAGRLRDVREPEDSFAVLAWFTQACCYADWANLMWEIDSGPRYRYEWRNGELTKLKGVLDL